MISLSVTEIFHSLQGETTRTGVPTVFARLAGCNLRCGYCDTAYAWEEGNRMTLDEIVRRIASFKCHTVEITGGEPLAQEAAPQLAERLLSLGYRVMVETNGTRDISVLPDEVVKIVDIKCPGSGEAGKFRYENLKLLATRDEIKFVICSKADFDWALAETEKHGLIALCPVNISPAGGTVTPEEVAGWILKSGKNLRLNLQLHKIIWGDKRGV